VIAFLFIGWHVWTTRAPVLLRRRRDRLSTMMRGIMTDPSKFAIFLVGRPRRCSTFTNGIWTFAVTWGLTVGRRAQRTLARRARRLRGDVRHRGRHPDGFRA
jgi:succinate dehydrogenase / fumarate reductase cytochrome b subunit